LLFHLHGILRLRHKIMLEFCYCNRKVKYLPVRPLKCSAVDPTLENVSLKVGPGGPPL
jgi:hypothetical protein